VEAALSSRNLYLGIEGGATRTVALLADQSGRLVQRLERGPANLRLLTDRQLKALFASINTEVPCPTAIAIGLAGAWTEEDCARARNAASRIWRGRPIYVTHDLETALEAAEQTKQSFETTKVLILSGTGSSCYGRRESGEPVKIGGWGHILGDKGSGYEIGLRGLKAVCYCYDRDGIWPKLGRRLLRAVQLNEPHDVVGWAQNASKAEIAGLAIEVLSAWQERDSIASDIIGAAACSLARDGVACAKRMGPTKKRLEFVLAGSVLLKNPAFAKRVKRELLQLSPGALVKPLKREGAWGAIALAQKIASTSAVSRRSGAVPERPASTGVSPTEMRNPASMNLDRLSVEAAVNLMIKEESAVRNGLLAVRPEIIRAVKKIVKAFKNGGRLFYAGAGTSGRLGVLDASECPPTFRVSPDMVQGVIAGGQTALWKSIEGAEDDVQAGRRALQFRGLNKKDVVVGIAASGTTPFVWGALREARRVRASSVLVCFNPRLQIPRAILPDIVIRGDVGPEILTGSTRLKAGTATKLVLNMFTTISMVRLGKTISNLMVDLAASNAKLKDRAARIVQELNGVDDETARKLLAKHDWIISKAVEKLKRKRLSR
jgi:N-acetylmuramic acid 6-phosphate etherase